MNLIWILNLGKEVWEFSKVYETFVFCSLIWNQNINDLHSRMECYLHLHYAIRSVTTNTVWNFHLSGSGRIKKYKIDCQSRWGHWSIIFRFTITSPFIHNLTAKIQTRLDVESISDLESQENGFIYNWRTSSVCDKHLGREGPRAIKRPRPIFIPSIDAHGI